MPYPASSKIRLVSTSFRVFTILATFSITNHSGWIRETILAKQTVKSPLPLSSSRLPADEKSWQGGPPIIMSGANGRDAFHGSLHVVQVGLKYWMIKIGAIYVKRLIPIVETGLYLMAGQPEPEAHASTSTKQIYYFHLFGFNQSNKSGLFTITASKRRSGLNKFCPPPRITFFISSFFIRGWVSSAQFSSRQDEFTGY